MRTPGLKIGPMNKTKTKNKKCVVAQYKAESLRENVSKNVKEMMVGGICKFSNTTDKQKRKEKRNH